MCELLAAGEHVWATGNTWHLPFYQWVHLPLECLACQCKVNISGNNIKTSLLVDGISYYFFIFRGTFYKNVLKAMLNVRGLYILLTGTSSGTVVIATCNIRHPCTVYYITHFEIQKYYLNKNTARMHLFFYCIHAINKQENIFTRIFQEKVIQSSNFSFNLRSITLRKCTLWLYSCTPSNTITIIETQHHDLYYHPVSAVHCTVKSSSTNFHTPKTSSGPWRVDFLSL